ncbi:MAG: hypothetical protein QW165_04630 [Candidatus Woesearchaeota archaeon]
MWTCKTGDIMTVPRAHLPISLLDDLSYDINDDAEFRKMVLTARGIDNNVREMLAGDDRKKIPPRITDPKKRLAAFVIEKLNEVAGGFTDKSESDVRVFEYKVDEKQVFDYKVVFPRTLSTYVWRDTNGSIQRLFALRCEYKKDHYNSVHFKNFASQNSVLSFLLNRAAVWEDRRLDEHAVVDDLQSMGLKKVAKPTLVLPISDGSSPVKALEMDMRYESSRDVNGKPVIAGLQKPAVKATWTSVHIHDYKTNVAVRILYQPI